MWPSPTPGRPADRLTALESSPSQIRPTDLLGGDVPGPCAPVPPAPPVPAPRVGVPASRRQRGAIRPWLGTTSHLDPVFAPLVGADRSYGHRAHDQIIPHRGVAFTQVSGAPEGPASWRVLRRGVGEGPAGVVRFLEACHFGHERVGDEVRERPASRREGPPTMIYTVALSKGGPVTGYGSALAAGAMQVSDRWRPRSVSPVVAAELGPVPLADRTRP